MPRIFRTDEAKRQDGWLDVTEPRLFFSPSVQNNLQERNKSVLPLLQSTKAVIGQKKRTTTAISSLHHTFLCVVRRTNKGKTVIKVSKRKKLKSNQQQDKLTNLSGDAHKKTIMAMTEEKNRKISSRSMMGRHTGTTSRMLVHTVVVMVAFVALSSSSSPPPSLFLNGNQQLFLLPLLVDGFVLSPTTPRVSLHQCDLLDCKHQHRHHHVHSLHQKKKEWQHSKPWLSQQQPGKRTTRTSNTQHNSIIAGGILEAVDTLWKANVS